MPHKIEEVRTPLCLYGFKCGVREIEQFCKKAHKRHDRDYPEFRVRVLYGGANVIGFHTLSVKGPSGSDMMLDPKTAYHGSETFLYIDHFAVHSDFQTQGLSVKIMVDVLEIAAKTMRLYGRIFALTLNAANDEAVSYFSAWGFTKVTESTTPFMVMERPDVLRTYDRIKSAAAAS